MRLVRTVQLQVGDIIGKDVIGYGGGLLLRKDTRFREVFRKQLLERHIYEIYIRDEWSEGIEPTVLISEENRRKIEHDLAVEIENLRDKFKINVDNISDISDMIYSELEDKALIWEIQDLQKNDDYTYQHCVAVAILAGIVCRKLGLEQELSKQIIMGGLMHDLGKMSIPKDVLNKEGRLTQEEYEIIKEHSRLGYEMLKDMTSVSSVTKLTVLCHHEREDGSGYPLGKGEELHIGPKIVAACDLYHALISDRTYRKGMPLNEALMIAGREKINKEVRRAIEDTLAFYPVGSTVLLSNGLIGIVERNFIEDVSKPLIKVIYDEKVKQAVKYKINLQEEDIHVQRRIYELPF